LHAELPLAGLEDATLNRLGELVTEGARTLRLTLDVLGYAPVGPLHLGLWRVAEARLAESLRNPLRRAGAPLLGGRATERDRHCHGAARQQERAERVGGAQAEGAGEGEGQERAQRRADVRPVRVGAHHLGAALRRRQVAGGGVQRRAEA